nr:hypothetical protein CFP56_47472 [Quercus suber]
MTPKSLFFFFFFSALALLILLIPISAQISDPNPKPTQSLSVAHTELTNYGFPVGLLPSSVHGYSINKTSGDFSVELGGDCKITLPPDNYLATYSRTVRGKIVSGKIAELDGIRVRALFRLGVRGRHGHRQVPLQELRREPRLRRQTLLFVSERVRASIAALLDLNYVIVSAHKVGSTYRTKVFGACSI